MTPKKQIHLIAATHATGSHLRGWRHPSSPLRPATDVKAFIRVAQELERGLFDAIFLGETVGVMPGHEDAYRSDSMVNESLDPTLFLSAVASSTRHIGLITTVSTSLTQPLPFAGMLASLDHLSDGRSGWNVVTSRFETEARNFGLDPQFLRSPARYEVASEFVEVVRGLWESADSRELFDYRGQHFNISGSLGMRRPPQGKPVILQAGMSEEGRILTAKEADLALASGDIRRAKETREDLRRRAVLYGRSPDAIVVLAVFPSIFVAETRAEAAEQLAEFAELLSPTERHQSGILAGTANDIADIMEYWLDNEAADGFAVGFPYLQEPVTAFTNLVIPELRRRGRFRSRYEGTTLRENLGT